MNVLNILRQVAFYINKLELLNKKPFLQTSNSSLTTEQMRDVIMMTNCLNSVVKEVAAFYFPLINEEEVEFVDSRFYIADFAKELLYVKKIVNKNGKNLKFKVYPSFIKCRCSKAKIVYSYLPDDVDYNENLDFFQGQVSPQVFIYGVTRDWLVMDGDYEGAEMFSNNFKESILNSYAYRNIGKLPVRRFE